MDTQFNGVKQFTQQALWNLVMACKAIIEAQHHVMQAHHTNQHCQLSDDFSPGDLVYLSTKNLSLPKGWAKKLLPKFIGLYKVVEVHTSTSTITLDLLPELTAQRVHPMFHMSLIRAHVPNDNERFPHHDAKSYYDFGAADKPEWFVNKILGHRWVNQSKWELQVCWTLGDMMWEPLMECKELQALDKYLDLYSVK